MDCLKNCVILTLYFCLLISSTSSAETEAGICQYCHSTSQESPQHVTAANDLINVSNSVSGWSQIETAIPAQTSQMDAGYPKGCVITAMLYTLKFGPQEYRRAYEKIAGNTDKDKIDSLMLKFSWLKSRANPDEQVISAMRGTNPNDLPWMLQSLVGDSKPIDLSVHLKPLNNSSATEMLTSFRNKGIQSLTEGKPIIANLMFTNSGFGHAVVIIGIERRNLATGELKVRILDPATGEKSIASIFSGTVKLGDIELATLKFTSSNYSGGDGVIVSSGM